MPWLKAKTKRNAPSPAREIARLDRPAAIVDRAGNVLCRNHKALSLLRRDRNLTPLLAGATETSAALLLRPMRGDHALIWISPPRDGLRRILLLRRLTGREAVLVSRLMAAGADGPGETPEDPRELNACLKTARATLWTDPDAGDLIPRLECFLRLICGPSAVWTGAEQDRDRVTVTISFRNTAGIARDFMAVFEEARSKDVLAAIRALAPYPDGEFTIRTERAGKRGQIRLTLPVAARLPVCFFQGQQERQEKKKRKKVLKKRGNGSCGTCIFKERCYTCHV